MNVRAIESLNVAVNVMRHFIELSAKLLPYYERATRTNSKLPQRKEVEKKIAAVYEGYKVDPSSSEFLMNSQIIQLIQDGYKAIKERKDIGEEKVDYYMSKFAEEYNNLKNKWEVTAMN